MVKRVTIALVFILVCSVISGCQTAYLEWQPKLYLPIKDSPGKFIGSDGTIISCNNINEVSGMYMAELESLIEIKSELNKCQ